ncbi:MAG: hypothetical protein COA52_05745 [Hyphomicrobiales bacterium]|nr:MAG: hypothetical protein COA52_05745 [Hyphomicrobiales bacterium]
MNVRLRQDAIARSLRRNGTSTIADLAEEVGASRRTVLRDIGALRALSFILNLGVGAACNLIRNRFRPQRGFRSPRSLRFSSALRPCVQPEIYLFQVSQMLDLPKSRKPCRRTKSKICAGFWIACTSGNSLRR